LPRIQHGRAERVLHAFKADEGDWRQVEALRRAESTPYVGRAVVAPARNGRVMRKRGPTLVVGGWYACTASS
jgi:hypothetical protein